MQCSSAVPFLIWLLLLSTGRCSEDLDQCRDHPRLGTACKNVHNLREWCERSRLQSDKIKNNLAQVCRATCGFCDVQVPAKAIPLAKGIEGPSDLAARQEHNADQNHLTPASSHTPPLFSHTVTQCGQPPNYTACVPLAASNSRFQQCCDQSGIQPVCLHLCRYDVKVEEVQLAAFKQQCPFSILPTYFSCAASSANNTRCCRDTGVLAQAGPQCTPFCDPGNGGLKDLGIRHLRCAMYLEEIMQCHWAGLR